MCIIYIYSKACLEPWPRKFHCEWMWLLCFACGLSVLLLDHWRPTWCFAPATFLAWCSTSSVLAFMSLRMTPANRLLFLTLNVFASHSDCALVLEAHKAEENQCIKVSLRILSEHQNFKVCSIYLHCAGYILYSVCTCRHMHIFCEPTCTFVGISQTCLSLRPATWLCAWQAKGMILRFFWVGHSKQ